MTYTASTEIYTLSLHDALPISPARSARPGTRGNRWKGMPPGRRDRKSTRLNSSHVASSYAVFCSKKKSGYGGGADVTRSGAAQTPTVLLFAQHHQWLGYISRPV